VPARPGTPPPPSGSSSAAPDSRPATSPASGSPPVSARPAGTSQAAPAGTTTAGAPTQVPPAAAEPAASDFAHLDEVPTEPDGRAAGEALAQKYKSGGSSSYSTTRFSARPRVPRGITLPERPAAATLLYLHSVEEAYHRTNGRYASLRELRDAKLLALDVPLEATGFKRARYAFQLVAEGGSYRAEALPQGPVGRAFLVDDSGFVRFRDE
jgi:hypothetical protein